MERTHFPNWRQLEFFLLKIYSAIWGWTLLSETLFLDSSDLKIDLHHLILGALQKYFHIQEINNITLLKELHITTDVLLKFHNSQLKIALKKTSDVILASLECLLLTRENMSSYFKLTLRSIHEQFDLISANINSIEDSAMAPSFKVAIQLQSSALDEVNALLAKLNDHLLVLRWCS